MKFSVSQRNHALIAHNGGERWRALWEMSLEAIALALIPEKIFKSLQNRRLIVAA